VHKILLLSSRKLNNIIGGIMKQRILRFSKHFAYSFLILLLTIISFGLFIGAEAHYGDNPLMVDLDREGPYVFFKNDTVLNVNYIRGNKKDGFYSESENHRLDTPINASYFFPLDSSSVNFSINTDFTPPKTIYNDNNTIMAISDIESSYKTFRDFLMNNRVIDINLNWTFGKGHLVLVGDFVDRGNSTTQVLWFIYKLEQEAQKHGGFVHYIIGNHEIKNMQGRYNAASKKYYGISGILEKRPHELYGSNSFLGRWMSTKNTIELINGNLFAHGGVHPELIDSIITLDKINQIVRRNYYKIYVPKPIKNIDDLLLSNRKGIAWYRGYFKDDLSQNQIDSVVSKFNAKSIIMGHTIQSSVNRQYNGKVIGIDVRHPRDYRESWPTSESEGLLIDGDKYYRVFDDGEKEEI